MLFHCLTVLLTPNNKSIITWISIQVSNHLFSLRNFFGKITHYLSNDSLVINKWINFKEINQTFKGKSDRKCVIIENNEQIVENNSIFKIFIRKITNKYLGIIHGEKRLQVWEQIGVNTDQRLYYRDAREWGFGAGNQFTLFVELSFAVK